MFGEAMTSKIVTVVAPLSALSRRTRLFKLARYLQANARTVQHIAWERCPGEGVERGLDNDIEKRFLLKGGGYGTRHARAMYPIWMLRVLIACLGIERNHTVWALGFESAFPAVVAGKFRGFKVVFDDADRFSLLFPLPAWLRGVVARLEAWTSRNSDVHIVPGEERYDFDSNKFLVVRNMPSLIELQAARRIGPPERPDADLVININGWLGSGRGMATALQVARRLQGERVAFLLVGKIDCEEAEEMTRLDNVVSLGEVSNASALATYLASDYVFTYYKPNTVINRFAQSNKWGDAVKTSVGVIVNSEVETAEYLRKAGAAISVAYDDVDGLCRELRTCLADRRRVMAHREASGLLGEQAGFYDDSLDAVFSEDF